MKSRNTGFTLVELLMIILLAVFVISLSSIDYYQEPLKGRADRSVNLTQNLIFAVQNYYAHYDEWPGEKTDGEGVNERCKNSFVQLYSDSYVGIPRNSEVENVFLNAFTKPITVNCENQSGELNLAYIYIRQCVPDDWVGYMVNALPNTHQIGDGICSPSDHDSKVILTQVPRPGWENIVNIEEVSANESIDIHDCPTGKEPDLVLMSPRACMNTDFKRGRIPIIDPDEYDVLRGLSYSKINSDANSFDIRIRASYFHMRGLFATFWNSRNINPRECGGQKNGKVIINRGRRDGDSEEVEREVWNDGENRVFALRICRDM